MHVTPPGHHHRAGGLQEARLHPVRNSFRGDPDRHALIRVLHPALPVHSLGEELAPITRTNTARSELPARASDRHTARKCSVIPAPPSSCAYRGTAPASPICWPDRCIVLRHHDGDGAAIRGGKVRPSPRPHDAQSAAADGRRPPSGITQAVLHIGGILHPRDDGWHREKPCASTRLSGARIAPASPTWVAELKSARVRSLQPTSTARSAVSASRPPPGITVD